MIIHRYGITLELLTEPYIEMVRKWRNDKKIAKHMFYRGEITPEMQREWYESVYNEYNYFFLIKYHGEYIGLINMSSVDWDNLTAYSGLFVYQDAFIGTHVPVSASLTLLDVFFQVFQIQTVFAKVRGNNRVAHYYNTMLGFARTKKIELGLGYEYLLHKEVYLLSAGPLRNAAMRLYGNTTQMQLNENDLRDRFIRQRLNQISSGTFALLGLQILS
ncbi:MAG: GNAT family N-acetyltransferase [Chitinophagales bacterium]|nr:GNAT family N-acetyltransferase [Chitinophagales bacterium]MDW8418153.1 GNAT family N-acetyltransferase [Chitinophagales bacterium]